MNITWKELYAIVIAVHKWGVHGSIRKYYDNLTVWAKDSTNFLRSWPWYGYYIFVLHVITLMLGIQHISGTENKIAGAISHFQHIRFRELVPMYT